MKRFLFACIILLVSGLFVRAYGDSPITPADRLLLFQGINLSYNNHYPEAAAKLREYLAQHPNDLVAAWRLSYNRFFEIRSWAKLAKPRKPTDAEVNDLIASLSTAIGTFENGSCHDADLKALADSWIDCPFVGAALYQLRVGVRVAYDSKWKTIPDYSKFWTLVGQSHSPHAHLLAAAQENEVSHHRFHSWFHDKHGDFDEGVRNLLLSFTNETDPFVNDSLLLALRIWREHTSQGNPCSPNVQKGSQLAKLLDQYPPSLVVNYLDTKCPGNSEVKEFSARCGIAK